MADNAHEDRLTKDTLEVIQRFNDAFNRHDVGAVMAAMTEDCVFENTHPPPDGERYYGQAAVRAFWERFFASSPHATFETEDIFAGGDRGVVCWLYRWVEQDGKRGHIRGVDVFRVRDGKVAEKFSYVKG
jgi:ketosteroid isomerase-like protein